MRVALSFPGCHTRGGVERIVLECARFLVGRGHDVHVFASEFDENASAIAMTQHPVQVARRPNWLYGHRYHKAATAALATERFDVLNTHGCVCPVGGVHWVQSIQAAWLDRCKEMRGRWSWSRLKQRLNPLHPVLLRMEEAHFGRRAYRKVIATTPQVRDDLHRYYGVPSSDVVIIPNGFNPLHFNPAYRSSNRTRMREELRLNDSDFVLLFVANELERKGFPTLMNAVRSLGDRSIKIIAAGRPSVSSVRAMADAYGVGAQVLAVGGGRRVPDLHAAADVMVLPTQYEAFCLAILESLGSGLPVITSNVPGARDAITAENGIVFGEPLDDRSLAAAIRQFQDPRTLQQVGSSTPATATEYQWPAVLERYERVLAEHVNR